MIQLTADSTCDLGESIAKHDIGIMPLSVILGENAYRDGVDIMPKDIFAYVEKTGQLPKTAAPSIGDYEDFFASYVDRGDTVIHFSISAKASSANSYAEAAAKRFPGKVYVVDSKALSTGQGLLILKAADLREAGKSAEEIVNEVNALRPLVNTSFVPDRLDYLYWTISIRAADARALPFTGRTFSRSIRSSKWRTGSSCPGKSTAAAWCAASSSILRISPSSIPRTRRAAASSRTAMPMRRSWRRRARRSQSSFILRKYWKRSRVPSSWGIAAEIRWACCLSPDKEKVYDKTVLR